VLRRRGRGRPSSYPEEDSSKEKEKEIIFNLLSAKKEGEKK